MAGWEKSPVIGVGLSAGAAEDGSAGRSLASLGLAGAAGAGVAAIAVAAVAASHDAKMSALKRTAPLDERRERRAMALFTISLAFHGRAPRRAAAVFSGGQMARRHVDDRPPAFPP